MKKIVYYIIITLLVTLSGVALGQPVFEKILGGDSPAIIFTEEIPLCWFSPTDFNVFRAEESVQFKKVSRDEKDRIIEYSATYKEGDLDEGVEAFLTEIIYAKPTGTRLNSFQEARTFQGSATRYLIDIRNIRYSGSVVTDFNVIVVVDPDFEVAPIIHSIDDEKTMEGIPYTGPTPTLERGTEPVTWSLTKGPASMSIDEGTGVVTWLNPVLQEDPYKITIKAGDKLNTE